jgi:Ice-binding-like
MNKIESYSKVLTWFMALLLVALAAGCGGGGGRDPILGSGLPDLVSLAVTPATASIPITGTQQFTATATFSDGSSRNVTTTSSWISGTPGNATVGPATGVATGLAGGTSLITATFGGKSGSATLTVTTATPFSFMVTPGTASTPVSGTQQFAAIQIFSDGTSQDRTTTSVWSTSGASAANASVGAATGRALGITVTPALAPVVINATFTPLGGPALVATPAALIVNNATSTKFEVIPAAASIPVSGTQQFAAIQTFSDGTTQDRTAPLAAVGTTIWTTSGASAANASVGAATGKALGITVTPALAPVVINATFTPVGGLALVATPAALIVNNATSTKFEVIPTPASTTVGGTQQFAAVQTFSDGTTQDRTAPLAAVGTTSWTTSGASALNASVGALTGKALGITVTPALAPVVINATFTPVGGLALAATPAALTVIAAVAGNPGPAGAVDCLTACPYGLVAWNAITNSAGPSHIFGDAALTEPGPGGTIASVTGPGFNDVPGVPLKSTGVTNSTGVTPGVIIAADNGILPAQLLIDVRAMFDNLMLRAPGPTALTTPASAAAVGVNGGTFAAATDLSGYVLRPGVYATTASYGLSNINGPLVLDAGGNADAVFVIRSTSAVTGITSTTGSVVLQGGAQSKNVFWVLNDATIGGSTFFQGTVVAGHTITLLGFANVEGRMLAGALGLASGALTLTSTNVITVPK